MSDSINVTTNNLHLLVAQVINCLLNRNGFQMISPCQNLIKFQTIADIVSVFDTSLVYCHTISAESGALIKMLNNNTQLPVGTEDPKCSGELYWITFSP